MKNKACFVLLFSLLFTTFAATAVAGEKSEIYGDGVSLAEVVPIADLLADPHAWADKEVRVEGKVVGVCPRKGCWIAIESRDQDRLRVKVEDDVIVFPPESEGRWAAAQGVVTVREMSREQWISWQSHLADEKGETFDASSVGEGPFLSVMIQAGGAELSAPASR